MSSEAQHNGPTQGEQSLSEEIARTRRHLEIPWLVHHYPRKTVLTGYTFLAGGLSIAIMCALSYFTGSALIFPALGASAILFYYTPTQASASPKHTVLGQLIAVIAGYFSLAVTGLLSAGSAVGGVITPPRILAASLALALSITAMTLLKVVHPPAGATTLTIALGSLTQPGQMLAIMVAVVALTLIAFTFNHLAGIRYPLWSPTRDPGGQVEPPAQPAQTQQ